MLYITPSQAAACDNSGQPLGISALHCLWESVSKGHRSNCRVEVKWETHECRTVQQKENNKNMFIPLILDTEVIKTVLPTVQNVIVFYFSTITFHRSWTRYYFFTTFLQGWLGKNFYKIFRLIFETRQIYGKSTLKSNFHQIFFEETKSFPWWNKGRKYEFYQTYWTDSADASVDNPMTVPFYRVGIHTKASFFTQSILIFHMALLSQFPRRMELQFGLRVRKTVSKKVYWNNGVNGNNFIPTKIFCPPP